MSQGPSRATHLVASHVVQAEDELDAVRLKHCYGHLQVESDVWAGEGSHLNELIGQLHWRQVNAADDLSSANTLGNPLKAGVQQVSEPAPTGAGRGHDGHLRTGVDKRNHWSAIDLAVDIQHHHLGKPLHGCQQLTAIASPCLGVVLNRTLHVCLHIFVPDPFLNLCLSLEAQGVGMDPCLCSRQHITSPLQDTHQSFPLLRHKLSPGPLLRFDSTHKATLVIVLHELGEFRLHLR